MSSEFVRRQILLASLLVYPLCSCQPAARSAPDKAATQPQAQASAEPVDRAANDAGRFLAGLPGKPGSVWASFETEAAWKAHRSELDQAWARAEKSLLPGMREFQKRELSGETIAKSVVFYPFGGPDALTMTVFFPDNANYVMVGLEPPGTLPKPESIARKNLKGYLSDVRDTVSSELHRSFFITRQMDGMFRGQVTDGLMAPILHLLVRTRHTILSYRYVRLDAEGNVIERAASEPVHGTAGNPGVEIEFRQDDGGPVHKLQYFSVNLSDERLRGNKAFLAFLAKRKGMTTFLKATSYMVHKDTFSIIRDQILAGSAAVLQDDSGIPYRFFPATAWQVQLYGDYEKPYGSFRYMVEPDLREAYKTQSPKPLGFRIGYGFSRAPSNLRLAKKTGA